VGRFVRHCEKDVSTLTGHEKICPPNRYFQPHRVMWAIEAGRGGQEPKKGRTK
jgi:hypothetical protein